MLHMLRASGSGGMPSQKNLMLKYCNLETFPLKITPVDIILLQQVLANGKVLVGSNNHMMHILTISGNSKACGSLLYFRRVWGVTPEIFVIKIP